MPSLPDEHGGSRRAQDHAKGLQEQRWEAFG